MRILILTTHLNPGGVSRYVLNLAKGLVEQKNIVWVASSGGEWVSDLKNIGLKHKNVTIKTKSIFSPKILISFFQLRRLILEEQIEVVHCNTRVTQSLGNLIYRKLAVPYISTYHGFYQPRFFRKLIKLSGLFSIAVSKKVKEHLVGDLGINSAKIRVVYNGISLDEFMPAQDLRAEYGFLAEEFLVGILGRISEEKGHFLALEAIAKVLIKHKNVRFLISGEGRLKDKLIKLINNRKLSQAVRFIDSTPGQFLDMLDLLLVPSKKEGFGYAVVEAFAKKVPVIGYNTGGITEIIRSRENGILFYSYEPFALAGVIEELITDTVLRSKLVEAAHKDAAKFSLQGMASETLKVYQEAIQ